MLEDKTDKSEGVGLRSTKAVNVAKFLFFAAIEQEFQELATKP